MEELPEQLVPVVERLRNVLRLDVHHLERTRVDKQAAHIPDNIFVQFINQASERVVPHPAVQVLGKLDGILQHLHQKAGLFQVLIKKLPRRATQDLVDQILV